MGSVLLLWVAAALSVAAQPFYPPPNAPYYTADSIVNMAADMPNLYAPNTFVAIFGSNLAYTTAALSPSLTVSGILPTTLPGTNVRVIVNGLAAYPYYVSPTFVSALLPVSLGPGPATLQMEVNGIAGPAVTINLTAAAPVLTTQTEVTPTGAAELWGAHADGTAINQASPAAPGEAIFLFATGLGQTNPPMVEAQVPTFPSQIAGLSSFSVLVNGTPLPANQVGYVGDFPGNAGVYVILIVLPNPLPHDPEIRIAMASLLSPPQTALATQ
jgi:uncharacterized protein (TIGR03437 family)